MRDGVSPLTRSIRPAHIIAGFGTGAGLYGLTMLLRLSSLGFYGFILGLGSTPSNFIPMFAGAILGLALKKRFDREAGERRWIRMAPLLYLGFTVGMQTASVLIALVTRANVFMIKPF